MKAILMKQTALAALSGLRLRFGSTAIMLDPMNSLPSYTINRPNSSHALEIDEPLLNVD